MSKASVAGVAKPHSSGTQGRGLTASLVLIATLATSPVWANPLEPPRGDVPGLPRGARACVTILDTACVGTEKLVQGRWLGTNGHGVWWQPAKKAIPVSRLSTHTSMDVDGQWALPARRADQGGLTSRVVRVVAQFTNSTEEARYLWVGTDLGLNLCHIESAGLLGTPSRWTARDGLPCEDVTAVARDALGGIWVGTRGGLAWLPEPLQSRELRAFTARDGLPNGFVTSLATQDPPPLSIGGSPDLRFHPMVWVGTVNGLVGYDLSTHRFGPPITGAQHALTDAWVRSVSALPVQTTIARTDPDPSAQVSHLCVSGLASNRDGTPTEPEKIRIQVTGKDDQRRCLTKVETPILDTRWLRTLEPINTGRTFMVTCMTAAFGTWIMGTEAGGIMMLDGFPVGGCRLCKSALGGSIRTDISVGWIQQDQTPGMWPIYPLSFPHSAEINVPSAEWYANDLPPRPQYPHSGPTEAGRTPEKVEPAPRAGPIPIVPRVGTHPPSFAGHHHFGSTRTEGPIPGQSAAEAGVGRHHENGSHPAEATEAPIGAMAWQWRPECVPVAGAHIVDLLTDPRGWLWIATTNGVTRVVQSSGPARAAEPDRQPIRVVMGRSGDFLSFTTWSRRDVIPALDVRHLAYDPRRQTIWAAGVVHEDPTISAPKANKKSASEHCLMRCDGDVWTAIPMVLAGDGPALPSELSIDSLAVSPVDGRVFIGTSAGLLVHDGAGLRRYRYATTIVNPDVFSRMKVDPERVGQVAVRALAQDPRGALWIGTDWGVLRDDGKRLTLFSSYNGLVRGWVIGIIAHRDEVFVQTTATSVPEQDAQNIQRLTFEPVFRPSDPPLLDHVVEWWSIPWAYPRCMAEGYGYLLVYRPFNPRNDS